MSASPKSGHPSHRGFATGGGPTRDFASNATTTGDVQPANSGLHRCDMGSKAGMTPHLRPSYDMRFWPIATDSAFSIKRGHANAARPCETTQIQSAFLSSIDVVRCSWKHPSLGSTFNSHAIRISDTRTIFSRLGKYVFKATSFVARPPGAKFTSSPTARETIGRT
jgi:hypothetical protein